MNHQVKKMALFGIAHLSWPRIALCCPTCDTTCWAKHGKLIAAPFPHILLPRSNTAHPEHRERTLILFEEQKRKKEKKGGAALPQNSFPVTPLPAVSLPVPRSRGFNQPPIPPFKQMTSERMQLCTLNASHHQ